MTIDTTELTGGEKLIADLEALTAFLKERPVLADRLTVHTLRVFGRDAQDFAALAAVLGTARKSSESGYYNLTRSFGSIDFEVTASHAKVCERVVVGTEEVEEVDPEALAALPKVKVTREIVEWKCPESVLALEAEATKETPS